MNFKKACTMAILAVVIIFGSLLFGQILGGYYIYSLLFSDNLSEINISEQQPLPNPEKIMILRLEPITFNTLQIGIYSDGKEAQKVVNDLVQMGIRPYATAKAPYKIWVGCFGEKRTGTPLENQLREQGYEVFLGQGLINDRALKFKEKDTFIKDSFAPLLREYNLLLNNSLKMFKSPQVAEYNWETWGDMINKMQMDIKTIILLTDQVMSKEESMPFNQGLEAIKDKILVFNESLSYKIEGKNDKAVINSQSRLLEFIGSYHNLIVVTNNILGTQ